MTNCEIGRHRNTFNVQIMPKKHNQPIHQTPCLHISSETASVALKQNFFTYIIFFHDDGGVKIDKGPPSLISVHLWEIIWEKCFDYRSHVVNVEVSWWFFVYAHKAVSAQLSENCQSDQIIIVVGACKLVKGFAIKARYLFILFAPTKTSNPFFRGFAPNLLGVTHGTLQFSLYEAMKVQISWIITKLHTCIPHIVKM